MALYSMGSFWSDAALFVANPPLWIGAQTIKQIPKAVSVVKGQVQDVTAAFRPAPAPAPAFSSADILGSGAAGGELGSSSLPIILGAVAAGGLLLFALSRKKKKGHR